MVESSIKLAMSKPSTTTRTPSGIKVKVDGNGAADNNDETAVVVAADED
jgi:hypothetical protein